MAGIRKTTQASLSIKFANMGTLFKCSLCTFFLASSLDWMYYDYRPSFSCQALSSSSSSSTSTIPTAELVSVGRSQFAVLDGAEWHSVNTVLREQYRQAPKSSTSVSSSVPPKYGYMNIVTGKDHSNNRIVAMQWTGGDASQLEAPSIVYEDSIALIPKQISDEDAMSTYISSISAIYCALPRVGKIGGDANESTMMISTGKVVVLGSGDLACFSAEGLASLGMEVFMVNNKGNANVRKNIGNIQMMKPAMGESETGFSSYLGEFDSLVDTIGNERSFTVSDDRTTLVGESTLQMLQNQHKCYNYVSTLTNSQNIIVNEGIFGGPGKADAYSAKVGNPNFLKKSSESQYITPPKDIGRTLELLMKKGIILTEKQRSKACSKKSDAIRGWSLSDFWEQMSWPRDSSGSGATRFGLPVREDPDEMEDELGFTSLADLPSSNRNENSDDVDGVGLSSSNADNGAVQKNPYVLNIMDLDDYENEIVNTEKNCIMFMSAKFCKTCKTINPAFTRMARINQKNGNAINYSFVKAETSGVSGKKLAKRLSVRAVPSFVFVREGKLLGQTYASKLPDPKIDRAMQLLASGEAWDYSLLDDDDDDDQ
mmetsp:Transcript_14670/g.34091  ORF Transcript_14670/g.34091 Transcript_14670/m.34091 type:complete len:598 (+) Transcript_14670:70-1863(+)